MTDCEKLQAMQDANWTPAVEYWRQRAEAAEAERDDLIRDIESLKGSETEWLNRALAAEARPAKTAGEGEA